MINIFPRLSKNLLSLFDSWSFGYHFGQNMLNQHFSKHILYEINAD